MNNNEKIVSAIKKGQTSITIDGVKLTLPDPQTAGTETQKQTYLSLLIDKINGGYYKVEDSCIVPMSLSYS